MSLRLRLTLIYTGVLSSVLLLLSIVVYSLISILFVNLVDSRLGEAADQIVRHCGQIPQVRSKLIQMR